MKNKFLELKQQLREELTQNILTFWSEKDDRSLKMVVFTVKLKAMASLFRKQKKVES